MNPKRQMPLHKSMNRKATLLGVERIPAALLLLISAILVFSGMTIVTFVLGVAIFVLGLFALREMAKAHPQMTHVFPRNIKYRRFYPARVVHRAPEPHRSLINKTRLLINRNTWTRFSSWLIAWGLAR